MSRYLLGIALITILIMVGCSKNGNPVMGTTDETPIMENAGDNHVVTGVYNATFDPDTQEFSVEPVRDAQAFTHFDFTNFLDMCPDGCLKFRVFSQDEDDYFLVGATIENPSSATVFDARLLFADLKGKDLKDYDGITTLFPEEGTLYKPFVAWGKELPNRMVPAYWNGIALFGIKFNFGCELDTTIITECSFGDNIQDPYDIQSLGIVEGKLTPDGDTTATVAVQVLDWQDDVNWVEINTSLFNGQILDMNFDEIQRVWTVELMNENMLPEGDYQCLVEANSENPWSVNLYKYVTISVTVDPPTGQEFVYTKSLGSPGMSEVYKMYTDGSNETPLTTYGMNSYATGVSNNMQKIIFDSDYVSPGNVRAYRMDWDGSNETLLYKPMAKSCNADGSVVLLLDSFNQVMWIWNSNTLDFYQLPQTNVTDCVMAANAPVIAFIGRPGTFPEVLTCDLQGNMELQLTNDGDLTFTKENITITDDGMTAAYNAVDPDDMQSDSEIFTISTMAPDTQINITMNETSDDANPQFDGPGLTLVFVSTDETGAANIHMWDPINGVTPITDDASPTVGYANPDVSTDGKLVLFEQTALLGGSSDIWMYDMTRVPAVLEQITFDGLSMMPLLTAN